MNRRPPSKFLGIVILSVGLLLVLLPMTLYVVDQRQMAVVLQFGKPVVERTEPGLYLKLPLIQRVVRLPSTRQFWGDDATNPLSDLPTKDDKKIEIVPWAVWRVSEPKVFVRTLVTMDEAERRVSEFVRGAIRDVITQHDLAELVRSSNRPLTTTGGVNIDTGDDQDYEVRPGEKRQIQLDIQFGRSTILSKIQSEARRRLSNKEEGEKGRGIELIDIGISQIEFVESVQRKTFDRWIAEREAIAALNINEGERRKQEIVNRAKAQVERIEGEGRRTSNEVRGKVDAEVIRNYAKAIEETGEFYKFVRTLEAYEKGIGPDTRLILTTDSDLLSLLKQLGPHTVEESESASLNTSRVGPEGEEPGIDVEQ